MNIKTNKNEFVAAQRAADKRAGQLRTVDQSAILQRVQTALTNEGINTNLYLIQKIIQAEQQVCIELLSEGAKIVKWNYLTLYTSKMPGRKLKCPLDGKTYDVPENVRVIVRVGEGLRKALQKPGTVPDAAPGGKKATETARKTSERTRLYADRFVKEPDNPTGKSPDRNRTPGVTPGDKKQPDAQRKGAGQSGAKAREKRANPDTLPETGTEGAVK